MLSTLVGIHHGQISRIERGQFQTASAHVRKLCTFLEVEIDTPILGANPPTEGTSDRVSRFLEAHPKYGPLLVSLVEALEFGNRNS
jgi:hypothetical protein